MAERDDDASTLATLPAHATDETIPLPVAAPGTRGPELAVVEPDRYTDRTTLSQGGMGRIVTALDRRLNRIVALKELRYQDDGMRARFEREVRITALLEHPSIVTVHEAGTWPTGEPFYAMRLVPGRSLAEALGAARGLAARLATVPTVIAVADALAYAHGRGVIHRDLKPGNVMVGEFGETIVIDWGLAKQHAAGRASRAELAAEADDAMTQAGDVLGTPAYMPLEQATGGLVDERADVYAIGAILYHVIAGRPPYSGTSTEALAALIDAPPPPLEAIEPTAPPDLLAIARRAMARTPDGRYPSARELAEDLRKFQAGQLVGARRYSTRELVGRWIARHRLPIIVVLIAAIALVVFAAFSVIQIVGAEHVAEAERDEAQRQRATAERQRGLAEEQRHEVEELMRFMLFDVRDKLESIGHFDVLAPVARQAAEYYARHPDVRDDEERDHRMAALDAVGDVLFRIGSTEAAERQYRAALALARAPTGRRAQAEEGIGDVARAQGKSSEALAQYRIALATLGALSPDATLAFTAQLHEKIGDVLRDQGDTAGALAEYAADVAAARTLAATGDADEKSGLAVALQHVGNAHLHAGHPDLALVAYREGSAIAAALVAAEPADPARLHAAGVMHSNIGDALAMTGDRVGALAEYRQDMALVSRALALTPFDPVIESDVGVAHNKLGDILAKDHDLTAALVEHRAALVIAEHLAGLDPKNEARQREWSVAHVKVGDVLASRGDVAGALPEYRAALAIRERLAAADPRNAQWQRDLYVAEDNLGAALAQSGDRAGAVPVLERAIARARQLAATDPTNARWQADVAGIAEDLATARAAR